LEIIKAIFKIIVRTAILCSTVTIYSCQKEEKKTGCPSQPVYTLDSSKVKEIALSPQDSSQSSMIGGNESIGYKFSAKKGQKFQYQVKNPSICTWLYTPDNQLISNNILPQDGQYILQLQNIQGAGTFDIVMSLGTDSEIGASPVSTLPSPITKPANSNSDTPDNSPKNVIIQYYQEINNRDYQSAWNKLPSTLQENREVHPQGYQSFLDFFKQLDRVQVNDIALVSETKLGVEVKANICYVKNGNTDPLGLLFHLKKDTDDRQWKIDKVRLDSHKNSGCA
jgi:hypothetical protein